MGHRQYPARLPDPDMNAVDPRRPLTMVAPARPPRTADNDPLMRKLVPTGLQARGGLGGFNLMLAQPGRVMPLLIKPRDYDKTLKRHREYMEREEERERRRQRGCAFQQRNLKNPRVNQV